MWWIIIATVFYCLFSPSVVTKPVLCFVAPGWLFQMATNVHNNVGRAHGENVAGIRVIMLFTTILVLVCVVVCTAWMVGKRVNDPTLRWKVFFFIVLPPVLTYTIYELLLWDLTQPQRARRRVRSRGRGGTVDRRYRTSLSSPAAPARSALPAILSCSARAQIYQILRDTRC
jgi:hypothetical protein